ncbi:aminotransferase class I/II-fold pyridoxal phosphate-dependent enzyme [Mycolicibacterium smegmatis]|uniref:aminotransferase-like domain-containing protein n=1 Tax=Mycolicibacterium smegmatis TaxID=1772 RepID=UPI001E5F8146|nr:aminotransferase class I/II-fold pyridoxal phosphate-dependent enzyme [Mycolicibacterium smegmatis]UGT77071.1 aminotransferase class I/II-fold pyridoxal phosphate-dependent enzyme [Mycolicibacterium smegmatis]
MLDVISEIENRLSDSSAKGLSQAVTRAIREGVLRPGDRLPPVRELAHQLALSPTTVSAAWALLVRAGTIQTAGRRGTIIMDLHTQRQVRYRNPANADRPYEFDLSTGAPDPRLLPDTTQAMQRALTGASRSGYTEGAVDPSLMEVLTATWPYEPPAITVVDGALDALDLLIRSRLRMGDRVIVETPTVRGLLDLLVWAGIEPVGVPMDEEGMVPEAFAAAMRTPTQMVFLQPRAHNPTGIAMTTPRARLLANIVKNTETLVVEDECGSAISAAREVTLGKLLPGQTVHVRSYSKSHGPDLRLAAMGGPEDVIAGIGHLRNLGQGWTSWLLQRVLRELLLDPRVTAQVEHARAEYARRQTSFASVLAEHEIRTVGHDGLNAWVPVQDESAALMRMAVEGVGAAPGHLFTVGPGEKPHVRITVGLVTGDVEDVAERVVRAAHAGGWHSTVR